MIKIKSTATPCFFVSVECWGYPPQAPDTKDFSGKVLWNLKSFARMEWCSRWEILLLTFLIRKVREGGLERSSNYWRKKKKRGEIRVFCVHYQLGLSTPNPDTRNFSGKVSWNFKSFAKMKGCFLSKVLWHTFLSRKVCQITSLSHWSEMSL